MAVGSRGGFGKSTTQYVKLVGHREAKWSKYKITTTTRRLRYYRI